MPADITPDGEVPMVANSALRSLTAAQLLALELPPRRLLLAPWLPERGLAMVYAPRGGSKTWFALGVAHAVACGGDFLGFRAPDARRVLYVDGEMPAAAIQERVAQVVAGSGREPPPEGLHFISADLHPEGIPDLSTPEGQAAFDPHLVGVDLIVLDNLSTLVRNGRENEADSWQPTQDWALRQRRAGRSVLFIHHAGKGGNQRGTSKREDVLDTVIALRRPADYQAVQGARFELHFDKARGMIGAEAEPLEAQLELRDGGACWTTRSIADVAAQRVASLKRDGLSDREIAEETGLSKSTVNRLVQQARSQGLPEGQRLI